MILYKYFIFKLTNQLKKIEKLGYKIKLKKFTTKFKKCGLNVFIQFPVRLEGIEYITIGNNVCINAFVHIWGHGGVVIGDNTLIASHVSIVSVTHDSNAVLYKNSCIEKKVVIGSNVWIGTHATILPGIIIGDNAIIGAGSVVTKNVEANTTVVGVPAKKLKN